MSGSRSLALLAALVVAALGLTLAPASSQAALPATASVRAKVPAPPKVGTCRDYGWKGYTAVSETSRKVSCARPHTARVIKLGHFVKGTTWKTKLSAANLTAVARTCLPAYNRILGGTNAKRDRSAYTYAWFAPTRKQFRAGARWFRCDVVIAGRARLLDLPKASGPFLKGASIKGALQRCLDSKSGRAYSCATPHDFRSVDTFRMPGKSRPSAKAFLRAAGTRCPGVEKNEPLYATWASRVGWNHGDHIVVCYARD